MAEFIRTRACTPLYFANDDKLSDSAKQQTCACYCIVPLSAHTLRVFGGYSFALFLVAEGSFQKDPPKIPLKTSARITLRGYFLS